MLLKVKIVVTGVGGGVMKERGTRGGGGVPVMLPCVWVLITCVHLVSGNLPSCMFMICALFCMCNSIKSF